MSSIKFIQTLYFDKSINPLKHDFGWAAPEYHLMGWALSCLQLQRLYTKVDLYCNNKAASLLKGQLGLPYTNVYETHDDLNIVNENLWALHKIFTYSLQNEPFLHLDGDVFLFKELPASLLGSELIAQNMEEATPEVYSNTQKGLMRHFTYFPDCVNSEFNNTNPIKAVNAGILGGSNTIFMKEYAEIAFKYVNKNKEHLSLINIYGFNVFFEQHLFYCLAKEKGLPIGFLIKEIIKDDKYQHLGDFHETPCKNNYLHLIGEYKRDEYTCRQMAAKLRELYPEYYYRIISLCKTESAPLTVSFYTNKRFATISDYIQFNEKSKERYSNSLQTEIPEITDNTSNSTLQSSEVAVIALLKKHIDQMTGLSSITKNEADKDLIKFSKEIRGVLIRNKRIPYDYIYGRDLESVNWFCELFGNDPDIPDKMIMKCNGIAIIKSVFDWGGLLNKIKRIGIEYYEVLELEPGEFYSLVIPEIFADGFSIEDLDEMEKIILQHLSEPSLIKDLFSIMHIYVEDDIIKNHLDEYEHLIIVMLKQMVLKKAIKPFKKKGDKLSKIFPLYKQLDAMDCGPTCLRMVAKYYGRSISLDYLRNKSQYGKEGVSMLGLADAAESIGLKSVGAKLTVEQLINDAPLPAIIHWDQYHFVVLTPASTKNKFVIADPAKGLINLNKVEFLKRWASTSENGTGKGTTLLLEAPPLFKEMDFSDTDQTQKGKIGWNYLFSFLKKSKASFFQIGLGLLIGSAIQLIFPYLTQSIVDTGINTQNLNFIQIVLAAQLMLLFSQTVVEFIRSRILLHISTRINISLLSGFWAKLLKLPMQFFDSKHPGDIIQRIGDHHRIETFLTGTALNTFFSIINLFIFSFVLLSYNLSIFIIFAVGSFLYLGWIQFFLRYRRRLDYQRFSIASRENNATMQLVYGMQEIKLNNAENTYRWAWEGLQAGLFKLNFKSLSLNQYQQIGAFFINQGKNILITFIVAKLVIEGELTLGMMLAIQYIIGQLNSPVEQLIGFTQQAQDAKISLERLNDIHSLDDEEAPHKKYNHALPEEHSIQVKNLSFTYPGAGNEPVLKNINLTIPQGKVTAIVGMSGSGKTTLVKLLLRFYESYKGDIHLGHSNFKTISPKYWRSINGAVMQDSFIFNDNIRKNITVTEDKIDNERLMNACKTANILPFIESLPLGFYTKLGAEGNGISGGQKQRLAIARAVYKNPQFIFFDEATNSLDANNEKVILENLQEFFKNRTVIVVAHRLSTVKNADKIVVLDNGVIAEEGTHAELTRQKGKYYELVKNQLELGN